MINIYLIDDHQIIIDGISRIMDKYPDITIAGYTTNPNEGITYLTQSDQLPDVVICDISMPERTGGEVISMVRAVKPDVKFVMLTMHDDPDNVLEIAELGAEGYVLKSSNPDHFVEAIKRVHQGGTYYSSEVIHYLFQAVKKEKQTGAQLDLFTDRELEILKLVLEEKTSNEIADALFISRQTVDTHRKNILRKSGESTLIGLVKFGLKHGLLAS